MKFTVIIGKKEDKIFESFKYDKQELDEDEEVEYEEGKEKIKPIKDEDIILLNYNEVVSLEMTTESYQIKKEAPVNSNVLKGAKERLRLIITITGKITPVSETWNKIGAFTPSLVSMGVKPLTGDTFKEAVNVTKETMKEKFKFKDALNAVKVDLAVQNENKQWSSLNLDKSIENINKLKYWVYNYREYKMVVDEKTKEEKKVMLAYRDLLITVEVSDEQTLQYQFTEMYVSSYNETLSNKEGTGQYTLVLKQKLVDEKGRGLEELSEKKLIDFNLVPTISFGDKMTTFLKKLVGQDKDTIDGY
jgi:hypothetical protein